MVNQKDVRLAWVGADSKGRALRDFVVHEEDLGQRDEKQVVWKRSSRGNRCVNAAVPTIYD